jgi:uncharacterized protein YutE (UPF0331/DUF86 family)
MAPNMDDVLVNKAVRVRRLGIPQETREAFELLEGAACIDASPALRLRRMVGFRK